MKRSFRIAGVDAGRRCWPSRDVRSGASPVRAPKFRGRILCWIRWCSIARTARPAMAPRASMDRRWRCPIRFIWPLLTTTHLRNTISKGRAGTAMSAFAQKEGGMLTAQQIDAIIHGIRQRWSQPNVLSGVAAPPYAAKAPGNAQPGQAVYTTFCASCHGTDNKGGPKAGSVTNGAYLSLISNQGLRTLVIAGRPDFDAPDWRNNVPGHPMSDQEISDVVAWLAAQRPQPSPPPSIANSPSTANPSSPGGVH